MSPTLGTVLVVDDEASVLCVSEAILKTVGIDVETAESGDEAVEKIRERAKDNRKYAAVILDLTMPGGPSGFEVLEAIHEIDPVLPVIACSGYFQEDARELCRSIGFAEVLAKPHSPDALNSLVRRVVMAASFNEHGEGQDAARGGESRPRQPATTAAASTESAASGTT